MYFTLIRVFNALQYMNTAMTVDFCPILSLRLSDSGTCVLSPEEVREHEARVSLDVVKEQVNNV